MKTPFEIKRMIDQCQPRDAERGRDVLGQGRRPQPRPPLLAPDGTDQLRWRRVAALKQL